MVLNKNEPKTGKRLKGTNAAKEDTPAAISGSQKLKIFNIFKILKGVCQSHILPAIKAKAATPPLPFCYNLDFQEILKAKLSEVFVNFHSAKNQLSELDRKNTALAWTRKLDLQSA